LENKVLTDDLRGDLNEDFREKCFVLIRGAYREVRSRGKYDPSWDEEQFTQQMERFMEAEQESEDLKDLNITRGAQTDSSRTHSTQFNPENTSKIDIRIDAWRTKKKEYFIECKRLNLDSKEGLYRKYCKEKGLGQFVKGDYAENFSHGVMLGYVIVEDFEDVVEKVREKIGDYEDRLNTKQDLEDLRKENDTGIIKECRSKHERDNGMPDIEVRHFFLEFA
jgi:hypothetical protein